LWSERKEPSEVLEAYNSTKLMIFGNSSKLAPWHTKLGFQRELFIATLNSLTPDGGVIAVMDVVVIKVGPFHYLHIPVDIKV
jgi:breast cancer 2 susceptibility protein